MSKRSGFTISQDGKSCHERPITLWALVDWPIVSIHPTNNIWKSGEIFYFHLCSCREGGAIQNDWSSPPCGKNVMLVKQKLCKTCLMSTWEESIEIEDEVKALVNAKCTTACDRLKTIMIKRQCFKVNNWNQWITWGTVPCNINGQKSGGCQGAAEASISHYIIRKMHGSCSATIGEIKATYKEGLEKSGRIIAKDDRKPPEDKASQLGDIRSLVDQETRTHNHYILDHITSLKWYRMACSLPPLTHYCALWRPGDNIW